MKYFSTEYVRRVVFGGEKLILPEKAMQEVERCYRFLKEFHKDKVIYGVNTGFGPMAQWRVEDDYLLMSSEKALLDQVCRYFPKVAVICKPVCKPTELSEKGSLIVCCFI